MTAAANAARRWQGLDGIGRLLFMIKRVLFSGGLLLGAAYLGCGGDSGPGGTSLTQKPSIVTDRNSIVDTLCKGALRRETLQVTNHGVEDLVINSVTLASSNPALITGGSAPFQLLANGVLDSDPTATTPTIITKLKSNQIGFVALQFVSPDPGSWEAAVNISTNATNVDAGMKGVALTILGPDAGTQGCP
jgi:hypothetical protein